MLAMCKSVLGKIVAMVKENENTNHILPHWPALIFSLLKSDFSSIEILRGKEFFVDSLCLET